jgi:signal transduction histidine kinase
MAIKLDRQQYFFSCKPNTTLVLKFDKVITPQYSCGGELFGEISFNQITKQLEYKPQKDFTGLVQFILQFDSDGIHEIIDVQILVANTFKPRARIIKIIGQELISSDVIALVELIKNSFDADSLNIELKLNNIFSSNGEIIVKDDGSGMTYDKIINVWLEPATPDKKSKTNTSYSNCFERRLLGEKGIGRFAVHRLGNKIELITRASKDCNGTLEDYETIVEIDWNEFTEEKYLDEIPIKVVKNNSPNTFVNSSGTLIRVTQINPWKNTKDVTDAVIKIKSLESPVKTKQVKLHKTEEKKDPGITLSITSDNEQLNRDIKQVKSLAELLDTAFYTFSAIIDENGKILYDYTFNRPDYQDIKREVVSKTDNLIRKKTEWFEEHPITPNNTPGIFELNFSAWDLDAATLKVAGLADYYKNIIKPNAGVRVYRDNFRVWPYGEPGDDWLNLDLKRLNAPTERSVSRNQVFGVVHISSIENPYLKDQSNREGLIFSQQYEQFFHLVSAAIAVFANERKADKIKIDKISNSKKVTDIVTESLKNLKTKVDNNNHSSLYNSDIDLIEKNYHDKINDVLERYMMAAAIGISYSIPIHEMKLRLTSIKHVIADIEKNPLLQDEYLRKLAEYVKETDDIVKAVTSIMSRQKKQSVDLIKVAENVRILKDSELKKYNIEYEVNAAKDFKVDAVPGLLNTAILNIVDNCIYWLRAKKSESRQSLQEFQPKIIISFDVNDEGRKLMKISDNGFGFEDPFDLLIEPYYSRKTDGLGLGLYLVNEIIIRQGGRVNGYNNNGAVIELTF